MYGYAEFTCAFIKTLSAFSGGLLSNWRRAWTRIGCIVSFSRSIVNNLNISRMRYVPYDSGNARISRFQYWGVKTEAKVFKGFLMYRRCVRRALSSCPSSEADRVCPCKAYALTKDLCCLMYAVMYCVLSNFGIVRRCSLKPAGVP